MSLPVSSVLKNIHENSFLLFEEDEEDEMPTRAKKRRLDHLTWEEKLQRKKLKNRVAAQTSRDRKKARMEQIEGALNEMSEKHDAVALECENLKRLNDRLRRENEDLRKKLHEPCGDCSRGRRVECVDQIAGSTESHLQQRGLVRHSATAPRPQAPAALWKIVIACLLYRTSSMSSTGTSTSACSKSSLRACSRISPQTWRQLLKNQIVKNQKIVDKMMLQKWWGRHQNNWNPVEVSA